MCKKFDRKSFTRQTLYNIKRKKSLNGFIKYNIQCNIYTIYNIIVYIGTLGMAHGVSGFGCLQKKE